MPLGMPFVFPRVTFVAETLLRILELDLVEEAALDKSP